MIQGPLSILKASIQFDCPLCLQQYNQTDKYPMIICPAQHSVCRSCLDKYIFKNSNHGNCPQCRCQIEKSIAIKFRFLNEIISRSDDLNKFGSKIRMMNQAKQQLNQELIQQKEKNQWLLKQAEQNKAKYDNIKQKLKIFANESRMWKQEAKKIQEQNLYLRKLLSENQFLNDLFPKTAVGLIDQQSACIPKIQIIGNVIVAKQPAFIFGKDIIKNHFSLTVRVQRFKQYIGIGVVDKSYRKLQLIQNIKNPNHLVYYSNKNFWNGSKYFLEDDGYKEGDQVNVSVNVASGSIGLKINGKQISREICDIFQRQKNIRWVPFIILAKSNDTVILKL